MSAPQTPRRFLSLGAGVQSTTLALMAAEGALPALDAAIFADTGDEPRAVYAHLERLAASMPFPIYRVRRDGPTLAELAVGVASGERPRSGSSLPPWFLDGDGRGMLPKQCSKEFKTRVVARKIRDLIGDDRSPVEQWIGISLDEIQRMKDAEVKWIENRWPLIELTMRRGDCIRWLSERGWSAPKSSCVYCPFRGDAQWRDMRDNHPSDWRRAVEIDRMIRPGWAGMAGAAYVHRQRVPLDSVDLNANQGDLFDGECEGVCGV